MKMKTLSLLAGVSAPLILSAPSDAEFTGIKVTEKANPFGLLVFNVYAEFDSPGTDAMVAVAGTPKTPMLIEVAGGTFYNHVLGNDNAPSPELIAAFPSLAFDSFVTIGKKTSTGDQLTITPTFPGVSGTSLSTNSSGWAVTPNNPQGNPFDAANSFPGNGQVLIGQFSTANGTGLSLAMLLQFVSNGQSGQVLFSFFHVPTPGALAMMGAAGLIGTRRRRRHRRE